MLRNVMDGSVREVETNSDEYVDLINERYDHEGSARPKWEITGLHHTQRLDNDGAVEEDFGYSHKPLAPLVANLDDIKPEQHPERALTPGEVDSGVESWEAKMESINASQAESGVIGHTADHPAEPLPSTPVADRQEAGVAAAGRSGNKTKKSSSSGSSSGSSGSSGTSSGGSSGSGSGSAAKASGS